MKTLVLETDRILLRPLSVEDAVTVYNNWTSDPEVAKFMRWSTHKDVGETIEWLKGTEEDIESDGSYLWGFVLKESGELFGSGGLLLSASRGAFELGYNIMKKHWGKGLTTEASKAMLSFAATELHVKQFYCEHALENIGSKRVIEKLGFKYFGDSTYTTFDGREFPCKEYSLNIVEDSPYLLNSNRRDYTDVNSGFFDKWVADGWLWGQPISHETFEKAKSGDWFMLLTPTKPVPKAWYPSLRCKKVLGLASGGGQQMPIFAALGADCTVLDYSEGQLDTEREVAAREGYSIDIIRADMTKPLPFSDCTFDLIFHPVSNCYIEEVQPVWNECYRILKSGGALLAGLDNGIGYAFDDDERELTYKLPFNPLRDKEIYDISVKNGWGIQFSHSIDEQVGGQLKAGLTLTDIYEDTGGEGSNLHKFGVPTFYATRAIKP